jgi:hypothetical protein
VVGGRLRARLAERWVLTLLGDVGALGIGSDLAWQAFGGLAYEINEHMVDEVRLPEMGSTTSTAASSSTSPRTVPWSGSESALTEPRLLEGKPGFMFIAAAVD